LRLTVAFFNNSQLTFQNRSKKVPFDLFFHWHLVTYYTENIS
jgi:hypothetical protein